MGLEKEFQKDIEDIAQIEIVPMLLDVVARTTKMRFVAIARVTEDRWITCSVKDEIQFGLKPGDELEIKTTICNEIRVRNELVVIDHVAEDEIYRNHHTPALYGFQSYISVPIIRKDGSFFGTLCAIDPAPNELKSPEVIGMFNLYADLISFHLQAVENFNKSKLVMNEERILHKTTIEEQNIFRAELEKKVAERTVELSEKNDSLSKMNNELESFAYISSHDLQEPLRKIELFASHISDSEKLSEKGKYSMSRMMNAAQRMRSLLDDLLTYSRTIKGEKHFENIELSILTEEIKNDLQEELQEKNGVINLCSDTSLSVIVFQFRQLLYNLISNSIKFASKDRSLKIDITCSEETNNADLPFGKKYFHLIIEDNGIGFEEKYNDQLFRFFRKFHNTELYEGTGFGLAIVKRIVENHNGIITAKGKPDEGAHFDLYLPLN